MMPRRVRRDVEIPSARRPAGGWASRREFIADLRDAIRAGRLRVAYQPLVALPGARWVGVESLARWTDPRRGRVPPDAFIPAAEEAGLMPELTRLITHQVSRDWSRWRRNSRGRGLQVAVNISAGDLRSCRTLDAVTDELRTRELPLDQLTLEITETMPLRVGDGAADRLGELRDGGTEVALDDFGAGRSRLADLREVPLTTLKLDRSFTHATGDADTLADPQMAAGVAELATIFGLDAIAEGVETEGEADALSELGYGRAQGWLFGRPVSGGEIERACESP